MVPKNHPRYKSLMLREKIEKAYKEGILADAGMIAHGRGEAFDYLLGEKTTKPAKNAIQTAAASLILAENPVISVNGNTAALVSREVVKLADILNARIEINLFHSTPERVAAIEDVLKKAGAEEVLGTESEPSELIEGLSSPRANVSLVGIYKADVVLVPLEDGDRTEALVAAGKFVITIDLNPLSRTSKKASITIVDNIVRAMPVLIDAIKHLKRYRVEELRKLIVNFNNFENLEKSLKKIIENYMKSDVGS